MKQNLLMEIDHFRSNSVLIMPTKKSAPALPSSPEEVGSPVNGEAESPPAAVKSRKRKAEPEEVPAAAKRKGGGGKLGGGLAAGTIPEDAEVAGRSGLTV